MDQRLTDRLTKYWNQLRGAESLPPIGRLNPDRVYDLWPNCMMVQVVTVHAGTHTYSYEYVGPALQSMYGKDMTGQIGSGKLRDLPGWQMLKKVDEVVVTPSVVIEEGQFINEKSRIVKFRACLLPFGKNGKVTHVVVGMSYREF